MHIDFTQSNSDSSATTVTIFSQFKKNAPNKILRYIIGTIPYHIRLISNVKYYSIFTPALTEIGEKKWGLATGNGFCWKIIGQSTSIMLLERCHLCWWETAQQGRWIACRARLIQEAPDWCPRQKTQQLGGRAVQNEELEWRYGGNLWMLCHPLSWE